MPDKSTSSLPEGWQRFLAEVQTHGLKNGLRTPEDFIKHFPPADIMLALADQPDLRAQILVPTVGTKKSIALKKSATSAGDDLRIALEEGETSEAEIVDCFNPDDRVRYLNKQKLWAYVTENAFWIDASTAAKAHIAFMLERALDEQLLTHRDVVDGITVVEIVKRFPADEIARIVSGTLDAAHKGKPFDEKDLLAATPPDVFVERIPLENIWAHIILPKIAQKYGFEEPPLLSEPGEEVGDQLPKAIAASDAASADGQGAAPADGHDAGWSDDDDNGTHETEAPSARSDSDVPDRRSDVPETAVVEVDEDVDELAALEAADAPKSAKSLEEMHPDAPTLDFGDVTHRPASFPKGHNHSGSSLIDIRAKIDLEPRFRVVGIQIDNTEPFAVEELEGLLTLFESKTWPTDESTLREAFLLFYRDVFPDRSSMEQLRELAPQALRHKFLAAVREKNRDLALKLAPRNPPPSPKKD